MRKIILDFSKKINTLIINENTEITGLFLGINKLRSENTPTILFSKGNLILDIKIKAVMRDQSSFIFSPTLKVTNLQKGINAIIKIQVLNISQDTSVSSTPAMEIRQPDISASHALAISTFDNNQLDYLSSRGLTKEQAEEVLINSFISDIISDIN